MRNRAILLSYFFHRVHLPPHSTSLFAYTGSLFALFLSWSVVSLVDEIRVSIFTVLGVTPMYPPLVVSPYHLLALTENPTIAFKIPSAEEH